jgi:hypothetical protein
LATRLTASKIAPARDALLRKQKRRCPLCDGVMGGKGKQPVLDHDHQTGYIRDVLCRNCNGMEGKVFNLARRAKNKFTEKEWLERLLAYYERHETPQHGGYLHPTHKTEAEKRLARNKKARERRAKLKAQKE